MAESPELTAEEVATLKDVANSINGEADIDQLAQVTGVSRRTILKIGAALGVGGIVGGGAASELVGEAQAAPDTTDADGNVGLPSDRVDVFADGVDANQVGTSTNRSDIYGASADLNSVNTGSLVIGGKIYEEDANSPINVSSTSSTTYNVDGSYQTVVIIPDQKTAGFDELQISGDTGSNYNFIDNADNQTTNATAWTIPFANQVTRYQLTNQGVSTRLSAEIMDSSTGLTLAGKNENVSGNISQFTFTDSGGGNRTFRARVFGRDMDI